MKILSISHVNQKRGQTVLSCTKPADSTFRKINWFVVGLALSIHFPAFIALYCAPADHCKERTNKKRRACAWSLPGISQVSRPRSGKWLNLAHSSNMEKLEAETAKSTFEKTDEEVDVGIGNAEIEAEIVEDKNEEYSYESERSPFPEGV